MPLLDGIVGEGSDKRRGIGFSPRSQGKIGRGFQDRLSGAAHSTCGYNGRN
jgi:hypothetical protein